MTGILVVACGLVGLVVGSFLNVVIYRVPRKESVVHPRSHCPACDTPIAERDNIPVLSWVLLGGRCRACGARISVRYPLVELATAGLFVAAALRFGADWALPAYCVFFAGLLALALIDLEHFLLPNRVVYPTYLTMLPLLVLAAAIGHEWHALRDALVGSLCAFAIFFLLNLVYPKGMAFGDVRLSAVIGLGLGWLGPRLVFIGFFVSFLVASLVGIGLILAHRAGRKTPIPFGVFLALGAVATVLFGDPVAKWWLGG
jgi:leader peptidase (prepilin peptidase)/N-methyltransferase